MKHTPTHDRIFVRQDQAQTVTAAGVLIPEATAKAERPLRGTVVSIGPKTIQVHVGQRVMFSQHAGQEYEIDGELLLVMSEDAVLGVCNGEAEED